MPCWSNIVKLTNIISHYNQIMKKTHVIISTDTKQISYILHSFTFLFPIANCVISLWLLCFQDFFFVLPFHYFDFDMSRYGFIRIYLAQLLKSLGLSFNQILEVLSHYFFNFFRTAILFLPYWTWATCMLDLSLLSNRSLRLNFDCFQSFFLVVQIGSLSSNSPILSSLTPNLPLSQSSNLLCQLLYFPILKFSFGPSLYLLFLCWDFLSFIDFQSLLLLSHF